MKQNRKNKITRYTFTAKHQIWVGNQVFMNIHWVEIPQHPLCNTRYHFYSALHLAVGWTVGRTVGGTSIIQVPKGFPFNLFRVIKYFLQTQVIGLLKSFNICIVIPASISSLYVSFVYLCVVFFIPGWERNRIAWLIVVRIIIFKSYHATMYLVQL